jgi:hypothetical protein
MRTFPGAPCCGTIPDTPLVARRSTICHSLLTFHTGDGCVVIFACQLALWLSHPQPLLTTTTQHLRNILPHLHFMCSHHVYSSRLEQVLESARCDPADRPQRPVAAPPLPRGQAGHLPVRPGRLGRRHHHGSPLLRGGRQRQLAQGSGGPVPSGTFSRHSAQYSRHAKCSTLP